MKKNVLQIVVCAVAVGLLFLTKVSSTIQGSGELLFFDDFSSNSLEKWQLLRGSINQWSVTNESLVATISKPFTVTELVPKDTIWNSDWKNISYSVAITPLAGTDKNISFSIKDTTNWFEIHFFNGNFEATQYVSGNLAWKYNDQFELKNGSTYTIVVTQQDDVLSISSNGTTLFTQHFAAGALSGKIGLRAGAGANYPTVIQFDDIVVRSLDAATFPHFKQTDPSWATLEYDSAKNWSSTQGTIGEYGCALASAAMILHAHGIASLPSGEFITPPTLNAWLLSQPDGYIGEGLVNFAAISRLTRVLHDLNGTTKLEYARHTGSSLATATTALENNNPVMLQIPGHFLVGFGLSASDILIKDPAYSYTTFSQHAKTLLSTRTFTPSNTDLSYIIITHDPALSLTLTNTVTGQQAAAFAQDEYLTAQGTQTQSSTITVIEQPKPDAGEYHISLVGEPFTPYSFSLYSYTEAGDVTPTHISGTLGFEQIEYVLNYTKTTTSTITLKDPFEYLASELLVLQQKNYFSKSYIYEALASHLLQAKQWSAPSQQKLLEKKLALLEWFSWGMPPETRSMLEELLTASLAPP